MLPNLYPRQVKISTEQQAPERHINTLPNNRAEPSKYRFNS